MNYTIIGFGARGSYYAELFKRVEGARLTAVCETVPERLNSAASLYGLKDNQLFADHTQFFAAGRLGELCIVATQDEQHHQHALLALRQGYDLLLEKPIAVSLDECREIYRLAKELNRRVFVCHVLRYAPFFRLIKDELDTNDYGRIATINLTENVAYWHHAHSYVRGNWRASPPSAPMIIAKCCHDLDIISWLVNAECTAVSSMGSLSFFTPKNAPEGSSDRCYNCAVKEGCPYNAESIYITERFDKGVTWWPVDVLCQNPTKEGLVSAIKTGQYGRCVWRCDNNAVDRQIVNMEFTGGATAHLTMTAFSKDCYRNIHVHCERGEIYGNMEDNVLTCNIFGKTTKKIDVSGFEQGGYGHGGGDYLLVSDIARVYGGEKIAPLTSIEGSMQSHAIGFAAEQSRLSGGSAVKPPKL